MAAVNLNIQSAVNGIVDIYIRVLYACVNDVATVRLLRKLNFKQSELCLATWQQYACYKN